MSYARFGGGSDVYVYADVGGYLNCCGCHLRSAELGRVASVGFGSTADMVDHLRAHEAAGHCVPAYAFEGLEAEREENDAWLAGENA